MNLKKLQSKLISINGCWKKAYECWKEINDELYQKYFYKGSILSIDLNDIIQYSKEAKKDITSLKDSCI